MSHWQAQTARVAVTVLIGSFAAGLLAISPEPARVVVTVAQDGSGDFNGNVHQPIQAAISRVRAAGGGEIVIKSGDYVIGGSLRIVSATNLTIRGQPGVTLRLPPLPSAVTTEAAAAGAASLRVDRTEGFTNGVVLHLTAPGKIHPFTGKPEPFFLAKLARVEAGRLVLIEPLAFPAPAQTRLYPEHSPNIFQIGRDCADITIEGLALEGGRRADDPRISGHVKLCGVLAEGPYSYEKGLLGPPVHRLVVRNCAIRHCYGRGVAMYGVAEGVVENCVIEDTMDEAVDLDHFAVGCRAAGNRITRCHVGVEFNDANDCLVASNRFDGCDTGINLWRWCKQPELNVRNRIVNNEFINNRGTCIRLASQTAHNTVQGNTVRDCRAVAVSVGGTNQRILSNTIIRAGSHAIVIAGDQNEVLGNRCYDNSAAERGRYDAIRITGERNRVLDNIVGSQSGKDTHRKAVADEGKDNVVRMP